MIMSVYDKVIYYCGIVGITISLGFIIAGASGLATDPWIWIGKASIGLVAGLGLFIRGYRAKQQAKAHAAQELLNKLSDRLNSRGTTTQE